jgi:ABC-type multidrug transport system ATPase subunit
MSEIINVKNLSKHFNDFKAVDDISFAVQAGDVYGFLGQNGAGKSTTIRMLLSLIQPTKGEIKLFEKNLTQHRAAVLKEIGALIERPDLYKYLSAQENLSIFARLSGKKVSQQQISNTLDLVGLSGRSASKVKTFSQGMKQRLGIAIALVHDPQLVILDEPTNGLDPQGIADVRQLILHLRNDLQKTVVISSHLLYEIEQVATKILIIHHGKKLSDGPMSDFTNETDAVVEVATGNDVQYRSQIASGHWGRFLKNDVTDKLIFKIPKASIADLNKDLVQANIPVIEFGQRDTLERYFLSLTSNKTSHA